MKDYTNFIQYLIYIIENIIKLKEQQNNPVNPVNLINNIDVFVDLKHYKIREIDYTLIKMVIKFLSLEKNPSNKRVNNVIKSIRTKLSNQPLKRLNQDLLNFINF